MPGGNPPKSVAAYLPFLGAEEGTPEVQAFFDAFADEAEGVGSDILQGLRISEALPVGGVGYRDEVGLQAGFVAHANAAQPQIISACGIYKDKALVSDIVARNPG